MRKCFLIFLVFSVFFQLQAANTDLPVKEWLNGYTDNPLIFYITGDGGFNNFSTELCKTLHQAGYDVVALNARSYFWNKKSPAIATAELSAYLKTQLQGRSNPHWLFIGYSFGADVLPFIVNLLDEPLKKELQTACLMAPSESTDFEIHWSDILGGHKKRDMDVVSAINAMGDFPLVIITGSDEMNFPFVSIRLKRYTHEVLPGGHHFDGDTEQVKNIILKHI
ncbi:MAG: virulence factor family protein [Terrimonas sp.]|nr:virulence factor family protein [Terrimonas sp.]